MKVGFFDYLIDKKSLRRLEGSELELWVGFVSDLQDIIIEPPKQRNFKLDHIPASALEAEHKKYDIIIFHPDIISDERELLNIEKLLVEQINKPTLLTSAICEKQDYIQANIKKRNLLEYGPLTVESIVQFIEKYTPPYQIPLFFQE